MESWASQVRQDPAALVGRPASALHELLDEVEEVAGRRPFPLLVDLASDRALQVIGDSHGDWPAVSAALKFARRGSVPDRFLGLGDYIHRATWSEPDPATLPSGSVWNAAYLLAWNAFAPDEVTLLRGNHEASRQIPVPAPTLLRELRRAYPRTDALRLWERLMGALEHLPLAARTSSGVFCAHGGIPPRVLHDPSRWRAEDLGLIEGLLFSDPELEYRDRHVGHPYDPREFEEFLQTVGCRVMIKGHAPGHSGRAIYGSRLLTIHTSDLFAEFGEAGVLMAEVPSRARIERAEEITLRAWDGRTWRPRPIRVDPDDAPLALASGSAPAAPIEGARPSRGES